MQVEGFRSARWGMTEAQVKTAIQKDFNIPVDKEQAEAYNTSAYPTVLKNLEKFLDGQPKVRVSNVISSTSHKLTAAAVVAA